VPQKFILIDQSIVNIAGHYYEYAMHVLEAAQRAGYEPYLATHKRFASHSRHSPWRTYPVYRYGFWAAKDAGGGGIIGTILGLLGWLRFRWRLVYNYSLFGVLWAVRDRFGEFLLKQRLDRTQLASLATLIPAAVLLKLVRFLGLLLLFPVAVVLFLIRATVRLLRAGGFPSTYLHSLLADPADLWRFLYTVFQRRNEYLRWWHEYRSLQQFRKDTEQLLADVPVGPGDVIFIPTLSAIEFMGLSEVLKKRAPGPSWHLLFRRDIYRGREADYSGQEWRVAGLKQSFAVAKPKFAGHDMRFYTDTDELTAQYNRLGQYRFATAAIPHTHIPPETGTRQAALRIIYVGDARGEKGYQYLPRLIEDLWDQYIVTGRVSFHLQSNYNIPGGEPEAVVAREQLELLAKRAPQSIELLKQPLTSAQYKELLLSGDINLLLYDPVNYYARSSGILVESLAAAIPVIAPANTWLSRQFAPAVAAWQSSLPEQMTIVRRVAMAQMRWQVHGALQRSAVSGSVLTGSREGKPYTWLRVPPGATHLLVVARSRAGREAELLVDVVDRRGVSQGVLRRLVEIADTGRMVEVFPIQATMGAQVWFAIGAPHGTVQVDEVEVVFLSAAGSRVPLSAVGVGYHDVGEVSAGLRDLIEHHGHYRATAAEFAQRWREFHNADHLVAELGKRLQ
jgi:hypothetical protein